LVIRSFFSENLTTARLAKSVSGKTGLEIVVHRKGKVRHDKVCDLSAVAKIFVGLSHSDGVSTSLLESMAMRDMEVQTSTASCCKWFSKSVIGVEDFTVDAVMTALLKGVETVNKQERSQLNRIIIRDRPHAENFTRSSRAFYH